MKIFESPIIIYIILILLVLICIVRKSNNKDIIRDNSKDKRKDIANMNNARRYYTAKKTYKYSLLLALILVIIFILWDFTSLEVGIIDYFSVNFYEEQPFNRNYYLLPIYILLIREIIVEVKVGDFLFKYLKVDEPVLEENLIKTLLYKKSNKENTPKEIKNTQEQPEIKQEEQKVTEQNNIEEKNTESQEKSQ